MKKGNKAIKLNLNEIRHMEKAKNLGAREKHKVANHLLRKFSVNSPVSIKKPKVEINDNEIVWIKIYSKIERPVTELMVDANNVDPKGVVPGNRP
jgi:hypothetical protein